MGLSSDSRHADRYGQRHKSFVDSIHLNLHALEVYYKDGRTARLLKTAHDEHFFTLEEWAFYQKKAANFLKEKVKLGEGKAFKTGKKNELGVHVVCRTNCLAAILITSRAQNVEVPFMEEWIIRMCLLAEGKLLARVLDNCVKKMPAELWAQEPRYFVDNQRMKYYDDRLNELLHDEIEIFRGRKSRTTSESDGRVRTISQSSQGFDRPRPMMGHTSPERSQTYLQERSQSLPHPDRAKSPMSKVEKGLSATMEKAGLVQINIWKALRKGQPSQERSASHPNLRMDKKMTAKMNEINQWNKQSAQERRHSHSGLQSGEIEELEVEGGLMNEYSDQERPLSPASNLQDLSAELNETVPIHEHFVEQQRMSSPTNQDLQFDENAQFQQQHFRAETNMQQEVHHQTHHHHGLDPTHQRQRTVSSNQEIPVHHRMRTFSSNLDDYYLNKRDHADQVREIISNHERSMSPSSFKIMDRTFSSELDDILIFQERTPSPGSLMRDPRFSASFDDKGAYQQGMASSPNVTGEIILQNDQLYPSPDLQIQHQQQPEDEQDQGLLKPPQQQIPAKLGKRMSHRMREKMIKKNDPDEMQAGQQPLHDHHHHQQHQIRPERKARVQLPKTPIQQRLIKWFEDRA